jgi:hypothetical protein
MNALLDPRMFDPTKLEGLIDEMSAKNHVRVVKYEARSRPFTRTIHKRVMDEISHETKLCGGLHGICYADSLRKLAGVKPIYLDEAIRLLGGSLRDISPNLRTNVGIDFVANNLGGTSVAVADWIALSNNTLSIAATDTSNTLPWSTAQATDAAASGTTGEYTALGVARAVATYAHTTSATSYTQTKTWTATGTVTALTKAGLFGGAAKTAQGNGATNILFLANTFTSTSLVNTDQLSLTWTVNI